MESLAASGMTGMLALQFAVQPVLVRKYVSPAVISSSLVASGEVVKLIACLLVLWAWQKTGPDAWELLLGLRMAMLPGTVYALHGLATTVAHRSLDVVTCNVLSQTKLLFTALFVLALHGKGQSPRQCCALLMISAGSVFCAVSETANGFDAAQTWVVTGVLAALAAAMLSGLGAVLCEDILVQQRQSVLLFSAELAVAGLLVIAVNLALDLNGDGSRMSRSGFFASWTPSTLLPVLAQSAGGILVGALTKAIGSIRKGLVITAGLIFSTLVRVVFDGHPLPKSSCFALVLVVFGVRLYCRGSTGSRRCNVLPRWSAAAAKRGQVVRMASSLPRLVGANGQAEQ